MKTSKETKAENSIINTYIRQRIIKARRAKGYTLTHAAQDAGLYPEKLKQYETEIKPIPAEDLWRLSICLNKPIFYFYEDMYSQQIQNAADITPEMLFADDTLRLISNYHKIQDTRIQLLLQGLIANIAKKLTVKIKSKKY